MKLVSKFNMIFLSLVLMTTVLLFEISNQTRQEKFIVYRQSYKTGQVKTLSASECLISRSNNQEITKYIDGNVQQMYTFSHIETAQTGSLTDYRYIGDKPNNYVYFNCKDDSDTNTCEIWRIVGVFEVEDGNGNKEQRLKLIKSDSIGNYSWSTNNSNEWTTATLNAVLNNGSYWNSLSSTAKDMIGDAKFFLSGGTSDASTTASAYYTLERSNDNLINNSPNWIGKVAVMSPSDYAYTYALNVNESCYNSIINCTSDDSISSWIYNLDVTENGVNDKTQWLLFPFSANSNKTLSISTKLENSYIMYDIYNAHNVRPVVYLKSNIYLTDGTGSEESPYSLSFEVNSEKLNSGCYEEIIDDSELTNTDKTDDITVENIDNSSEVNTENTDTSSVVNVDNTLSTVSIVILIVSLMLIACGSFIIYFNCIKIKQSNK